MLRSHLLLLSLFVFCCGQISAYQLPADDAKSGDVWKHPKTQKEMLLVPSMRLTPAPKLNLIGGDLTVTLTSGQSGSTVFLYNGGADRARFVTGFFMDRSPVTNSEYHRYVMESGAAPPTDWINGRPLRGKDDDSVRVTYEEAAKYAQWADLSIPSMWQYCAAVASKDGTFPWLMQAPDVANSPFGFKGFKEGGPWGTLRFSENRRLVFAQMNVLDTYTPLALPEDTMQEIRLVDNRIAAICLAKGKPVGTANHPDVDGLLNCDVEIKNGLNTDIRIMISNGIHIDVKAKETKDSLLPIGDFVFTYRVAADGIAAQRFWRVELVENMIQGSLDPVKGKRYEWAISGNFGSPISEINRNSITDPGR